jgi:hypothetical protein
MAHSIGNGGDFGQEMDAPSRLFKDAGSTGALCPVLGPCLDPVALLAGIMALNPRVLPLYRAAPRDFLVDFGGVVDSGDSGDSGDFGEEILPDQPGLRNRPPVA